MPPLEADGSSGGIILFMGVLKNLSSYQGVQIME
jgi:hypothetical protein